MSGWCNLKEIKNVDIKNKDFSWSLAKIMVSFWILLGGVTLWFPLSSWSSVAEEGDQRQSYRRVLSIAGSDSGGGAGVQADLKTFAALGCYGMSAITMVTAQNTLEVSSVLPLNKDIIQSQIRSVMEDMGANVIKIGALGTSENIEAVSEVLKEQRRKGFQGKIVLDPVLITKRGATLVTQNEARFVDAMLSQLFPLAEIVTPNRHEASKLLGDKNFRTRSEVEQGAFALLAHGANAVVIKACGFDEETSEDCLVIKGQPEPIWLLGRKIKTTHLHGTGCTFSAAISAYLAQSYDLGSAVSNGREFLSEALKSASFYKLGHGIDPVDHACSVGRVSQKSFFKDIWDDVRVDFEDILKNPFNGTIASGSASLESFSFYLHQDYIFLATRDKVYEAIYEKMVKEGFSEKDTEYMRKKIPPVKSAEYKRGFFGAYGSPPIWDNFEFEADETGDYISFLRREGWRSLEEGLATVLPCAVVYQEVAEAIEKSQTPEDKEGNRYQLWIDKYSAPSRRKNINEFINLTDRVASSIPLERRVSMRRIFKEGMRHELLFCQGIIRNFAEVLKRLPK
jgi:hydroxymethylpyrimidine/phosphomethylpyrimidine kinase